MIGMRSFNGGGVLLALRLVRTVSVARASREVTQTWAVWAYGFALFVGALLSGPRSGLAPLDLLDLAREFRGDDMFTSKAEALNGVRALRMYAATAAQGTRLRSRRGGARSGRRGPSW
jgi:hypothetical protein